MRNVVVEVRGGVVVEIYCDDPTIRAVLIDWDSLESVESASGAGVLWGECPSLGEMPTDTEAQFYGVNTSDEDDEPEVIVRESIHNDAHSGLA